MAWRESLRGVAGSSVSDGLVSVPTDMLLVDGEVAALDERNVASSVSSSLHLCFMSFSNSAKRRFSTSRSCGTSS